VLWKKEDKVMLRLWHHNNSEPSPVVAMRMQEPVDDSTEVSRGARRGGFKSGDANEESGKGETFEQNAALTRSTLLALRVAVSIVSSFSF
jgi:hypothetical protein